ncbi:MAG: class I SAM-dependent methyltransferase [Proteobacteria bacterium]|nr:class I SAM-dependent methyltransferase [Pseudomonadota bacterium]MBU1611587.1 class I SAM-dependent methyltransferase [Pseudomonadota bacterium]
MIPPKELAICFGGGDFLGIGRNLVRRMIDWGGLLPSERVLDVGCGVGRAAVPLTEYISERGVYLGMDTYPFGIDWASEHITPHYPNFRFQSVDVFNNLYNPNAAVRASEFVFPYPDASFDFVLLNSVFTHMLPEDVLGYVSQIDRVLDRGGRVYCTWFLMDDDTRAHLKVNESTQVQLKHGFGSFYVDNPKDPEEAVGYEEHFARTILEKHGLVIEAVHRGNWCGRKASNYQDVIIARKT